MAKQNNTKETPNKADSFTMKAFLDACVARWRWFLVSIVAFTFLGFVYVKVQQPKYLRTMSVLIKDQDEGGGISSIANSFSSLGLVSTNTNVYNELISLQSPAVMAEVVAKLHLDMNYTEKGFPHGTTLYGTNQPFIIEFLDLGPQDGVSMRIDITEDGAMSAYKFTKYEKGEKIKYDNVVKIAGLPSVFQSPFGRVQITANPIYEEDPTAEKEDKTYSVSKGQFRRVVEGYTSLLKGDLADRDAEVIDLSIKDVSEQRADDILNSVLEVYNNKWIADKNRMSVATKAFIDDRLALIKSELGVVDAEVANYKKNNLVPDLVEAGKITLASSHELDSEMLEVSTQVALAEFVADYVNNPANANKVIPINSGGVGLQLEAQIVNYNSLLLAKENLERSSSASNPIVKDYEDELKGLRESIKKALNNQVAIEKNKLRKLEAAKGGLDSQLSAAPDQAKYLRSVERELEVKESLYLFLLQKREENELTQTFTADNTRVITPPTGSVVPVSPKGGLTLMLAFLVGLALPAASVYVRESSNTKVRSRRDLEHMATPFAGEIPFIGKKRNKWLAKVFKKKGGNRLETMEHVVRAGSRDMINESFRIVRGNIDFMSRGRQAGGKIIMVTSFNPGSGKSFITYNLAASYAIKGKKVLIIDCDLRHGSSSQFVGMPPKGISAYLNGTVDDWQRLVVHVADQPGMDVLPIGHRPPNPAELLDSDRMKELVETARGMYDVVFLDCPPVDVVVDTQVLSPLADKTVFVVRAGLLEKTAVPDIDALYEEARFSDMSILLNGTEAQFSKYGSSGHGYYGSVYEVIEN